MLPRPWGARWLSLPNLGFLVALARLNDFRRDSESREQAARVGGSFLPRDTCPSEGAGASGPVCTSCTSFPVYSR